MTNISHELRTPVTVIRGSLEALCDEVVTAPEQVKAYHEQMRQEVLFLQRLVSDLLDLSRLQNTDFPIEQQEINLGELLSDAVRSANRLAQAKKISVRSPSDPSSVTVTGDYGRLRQMLLVILDNAIKFSPPESEVDVTLADRLVTIRDRGAGIAPADLPHIFDRFYRARTAENREGTGLGLAIAKQIADRHQLNIAVSSVLGEGTEFRLQF